MSSTTIARGNIIEEKVFATTLTPTQVGANTTSEQSFTILGLTPGDYLAANFYGAQTTGIFIVNVRVSAVNTAAITFANVTGGALTPQSGQYGFIWGTPENLPLDTNAL